MFESFSELSHLYAENYSVIDFVTKQFQHEVEAFLDEVREAIFVATSGTSSEKVTPGYRYWWIGGSDSDKDHHPQLSIGTWLPEIIHPGEVILNAVAPSASADRRHALVAVAKRPEFAAIHRPWNGGPWSLFKAVVPYQKENPVERVSRVTASLLLTLNDVYESTARPPAAL
jgi:hypothetical protein